MTYPQQPYRQSTSAHPPAPRRSTWLLWLVLVLLLVNVALTTYLVVFVYRVQTGLEELGNAFENFPSFPGAGG